MKLLHVIIIVTTLQILGYFSATTIAHLVFPNFGTEYNKQIEIEQEHGWHYGTVSEKMSMRYFALQGICYLPFLLGSLVLISPKILKLQIPPCKKMKRIFPKIALIITVLLMSGVLGDLLANPIRLRWIVVALVYFLGVYGLISMYQAKSLSLLVIGFISVLIAYLTLEALL